MSKNKEEKSENLPVDTSLYGEFIGAGLEEVSKEDLKFPFLSLTQSTHPAVRDKGARQGEIYNSLTGELFSSIQVIPVRMSKRYHRYALDPLGAVDKLKKLGPTTEDVFIKAVKNDKGALVYNMEAIVLSHYYVVLLLLPCEAPTPAIIPMKFSAIKSSREWLTKMQLNKGIIGGKMQTMPMFSTTYSLSVGRETMVKDGKQLQYYVWSIGDNHPTSKEDFIEAVSLYKNSAKVEETINKEETVSL